MGAWWKAEMLLDHVDEAEDVALVARAAAQFGFGLRIQPPPASGKDDAGARTAVLEQKEWGRLASDLPKIVMLVAVAENMPPKDVLEWLRRTVAEDYDLRKRPRDTYLQPKRR
jgi:hypothetical protein